MASKRQLKRFIFKLDRKLVRSKELASTLYKELQRQMKEIIANDGQFESRTHDILLDAYLNIGVEFASKQFDALTTGDYTKAGTFFLEYWKGWIKDFVTFQVAEKVVNMDNWTNKRYNEVLGQVKRTIEENAMSVPNTYIAEQLEKKLGAGVFSRSRAMTIARTETASIANEAKAKSAESWAGENDQKQYKMWVHRNSKDARDNHEFLDGVIIETKEEFQVVAENGTVDYMQYPHDPNASAENVINCNCQVVYMSEEYMKQLNGIDTVTETPPQSEIEAPQASETVTVEDLPPSTEKTIRDDMKDVFKEYNMDIESVSFNRDMPIEAKNELKNHLNKLVKNYNLHENYNHSDKIKIKFQSTDKYLGIVREKLGRDAKVYEVNFGHKYNKSRLDNMRAWVSEKGVINLSHGSKIDKGMEIFSTPTHEFAHFIATRPRDFKNSFFSDLLKINKEYKLEIGKLVDSKNINGLNDVFLGRYASTNINEFMAEAFTEYKLHSKPSPYAIKVGKLIDKHYKSDNMQAVDLICFKCKHFREIEGGCNAFPEGIPDEITSGENKHSKPLKGQGNDIVFEPIDEDE